MINRYIHTHILHAYIHTCMHAYIHTYIHKYIHTCIHMYTHVYRHVCIILGPIFLNRSLGVFTT